MQATVSFVTAVRPGAPNDGEAVLGSAPVHAAGSHSSGPKIMPRGTVE